jgi:hypothetical protein
MGEFMDDGVIFKTKTNCSCTDSADCSCGNVCTKAMEGMPVTHEGIDTAADSLGKALVLQMLHNSIRSKGFEHLMALREPLCLTLW